MAEADQINSAAAHTANQTRLSPELAASMTNTEKVWLTVRVDPGVCTSDIVQRCMQQGVPHGSVHTLIGQLEGRQRLHAHGKRLVKNSVGKTVSSRTFVALGPSSNPDVQKWLESLPIYEDIISRARTLHSATKDSPVAPLAIGGRKVSPPPTTPESPGKNLPFHLDPEVEKKLAKLDTKRIFWKDFEHENIAHKMAREHVLAGHTLDHRLLSRVVTQSGFGYRTKPIAGIPERIKWLTEHAALLRRAVAQVKKQWSKVEAEAMRPPEPMPEAPPPDTSGEAERVAEVAERLQLQIDPPADTAAPAPQAEPWTGVAGVSTAVNLLVTGARMLVRALVGDVVREELAKLPQASANLQPLHDQLRAMETRFTGALTTIEQLVMYKRVVAPDLSLLKPTAPPAAAIPDEEALSRMQRREIERRPVVLLVGGMSRDWVQVQDRFKGRVDIRTYSGERPPVEQPERVALVVGYDNFVSHTAVKVCKKRYGNKFMSVTGGVSVISQAIAMRLGVPLVTHAMQ